MSVCVASADEHKKIVANFTNQLTIATPHSLASSWLEMFREIELLSVQAIAVRRPRIALR